MPIEYQRVIADFIPQPLGDGLLALFDAAVHELFDRATVHTDDVIVMRAMIELENRDAAFEMMSGYEAGGLELSQHAVNGREADVLVCDKKLFIDILRTHVVGRALRKNIEDLEPWQGHLESSVA